MGKRITAAIAAVAVALEAILPHHDALPHIEVDAKPPDSGKDIPSIGGRRLNTSATLKLIPMNDLVTVPTTGRHFSLTEIAERTKTHADDLT
jgi:hypothetical protein